MVSKYLLAIFLPILAMFPAAVLGLEVRVEGLFSGSAVLSIDGKQRLLKAGQTSPEGVRLVRADSSAAVLEINGQRQTLGLSSTISSRFAKAERKQVALSKGKRNGYIATGLINGHQFKMLVDTGATHIAMNSEHAKRMGLDFRRKGEKGRLNTASGVDQVWYLKLDSVSVAGITVRNVLASVSEGNFPREVLLGMSYLNHVSMEERAGLMYLTEKY